MGLIDWRRVPAKTMTMTRWQARAEPYVTAFASSGSGDWPSFTCRCSLFLLALVAVNILSSLRFLRLSSIELVSSFLQCLAVACPTRALSATYLSAVNSIFPCPARLLTLDRLAKPSCWQTLMSIRLTVAPQRCIGQSKCSIGRNRPLYGSSVTRTTL
jgi:hypothetical protein